MSEQLDYVNSQIKKSQSDRLDFYLNGNIKTIEGLEFNRGYLKAMQDVFVFQQDYISLRNSPRNDEDE